MGVGKSAVCRNLNKNINASVWLDGDWCWMMNPFVVNEENRKMVISNIVYLLRNFLSNSSFEYVIFDWVMDHEEIFEAILQELKDMDFELHKITLTCSEDCLRTRIKSDIDMNFRSEDSIEKSIERLRRYDELDTKKIDTTNVSIRETVEKVKKVLGVSEV